MQIQSSEPCVDFNFSITKEKKTGEINYNNIYLTQQNKTMIISTCNQYRVLTRYSMCFGDVFDICVYSDAHRISV